MGDNKEITNDAIEELGNDMFLHAINSNYSEFTVHSIKTIQVNQFEPEKFETQTMVRLECEMTGIERMITEAILRAQSEYGMYYHLFKRKMVTKDELAEIKRLNALEIEQLVSKAKKMNIDTAALLERLGIVGG